MPDPSAQYAYQTDVLAGTTAPTPTQFLRAPDTHTLWGAGSLSFYPYPGHFLTDLYFESGKIMEKDSPDFDTRYRLKPSPWEGGSDAQPFLWNYDTVGGVRVYKPIPALATFFFTDYTYHSSMDTMKSVSAQRLRDVGLMSGVFAYYRANADLKSAGETVDIVKAAADQRFGWEKDNSLNHFFWALIHPYGSPATTDAALHEAFTGTGNTSSRSIGETQLLTEWGTWYKEAVTSARTMFDPADNTLAYDAHDAAARAAVDADMQDALANAQHLLAVSHFTTTSVAINGGAEWAKQSTVTLGLDASSFAIGGVTGMRISDDGTTWPDTFQTFAGSAGCTLPAGDGTKTVYVQFQDSEGNVSATVSDTIKLDTTGPTVTDDAPAGWVNAPVTLHFTAIDGGSGADYTEWKVGNGAWTKGGSLPISSEGITAVAYRATDKVGNMSAETSCTVRIDTTTPTTTATRLQDAADTGWVNVAQTVNLSAAASGAPVTTFYRVDGGATQTYGAPFGISAAGSHPVAYWSIDAAGNAEAQHTGYINIDTGKPVCKALYDVSVKAGRTATLKCRLSDPAPSCGTATVKITISRRGKVVKRLTFAKHVDTHGPQRYTFKASLKKGAYTWTARATDVAGNVQAKASTKHLTVK